MTFRLHYVQLKEFLLSISTKECNCQSATSNLLIDDKMFIPLLCIASTIFMYLRLWTHSFCHYWFIWSTTAQYPMVKQWSQSSYIIMWEYVIWYEVSHVNVMVRGLQTDITQFSCLYGILSIETFLLLLYWVESMTKRVVALGGVTSLVQFDTTILYHVSIMSKS